MALLQGQVGKTSNADSSSPNMRQGRTGEVVTADAHAKYAETIVRGDAYQVSLAAGAATAFTGGAAGTPLLSVYNPTGSGKNLVILMIGVAPRVAASAAGSVGFSLWGGVSAANTGALTTPRNMLSLAQSGSVAQASSNAATTSTTAVNLLLPVVQYYWATAAGAILNPGIFDIGGAIVCAPGNLVALGASAALTSATYDVSMIWEEVNV